MATVRELPVFVGFEPKQLRKRTALQAATARRKWSVALVFESARLIKLIGGLVCRAGTVDYSLIATRASYGRFNLMSQSISFLMLLVTVLNNGGKSPCSCVSKRL